MPRPFLLSSIAFAFLLTVAHAAEPFAIAAEDRACAADSDCAIVGLSCCATAFCDYASVNSNSLAKYKSLYDGFLAKNCSNTACIELYCEPQRPVCQNRLCTYPPKLIVDPAPSCFVSGCHRELCLGPNDPVPDCAAPVEGIVYTPSCEVKCLEFAQCSPSVATATSLTASSTSQCAWNPNPANPTAYAQCLAACKTPVSKPVVAAEDLRCASDRECSLVAQSCCASATCDYTAVNTASSGKYQELFSAYLASACADTACIALYCKPAPATCVENRCTYGNKVPITEEPLCTVGGCNSDLCLGPNDPVPDCARPVDGVVYEPPCETKCLQYAKCGALSTTDGAVTTFSRQCSWSPDPAKPSAYDDCLRACKSDPTVGSCFVSGCGSVCSATPRFTDEACPAYLAAPDCYTRCRQSYVTCSMTATGCNFVKTDALAQCYAECDAATPPVTPCADGAAPVNCFADPCQVSKCPAHPDAQCRANYCGGCNADFYVNGIRVDCAAEPAPCPDELRQVQCFVDPCLNARCASAPTAKCHADYCGGCRAVFTVDGREVDCDAGCRSLPCADCTAKPSCAYCAVSADAGVCVSSTGSDAERCLDGSFRLIAPDTSTTSSSGSSTAASSCPATVSPADAGDADRLQRETAEQRHPIQDKYTILVLFVVNKTAAKSDDLNVVQMFVDLIGNSSVSAADKAAVCEVLKTSLLRLDARIPARALTCELSEKLSVKRDVSFVANLAYPGSMTSSASVLLASFVAVLASAAVALF